MTEHWTTLCEIIKNSAKIELNPITPLEQIKTWEKKRKIMLPQDYVAFITQMGDGGMVSAKDWTGGELIPFSAYEEKGYSLTHIKKPFTLLESWMPDFGDPLEEGVELSEAKEEKLLQKRWTMIREHGSILLMDSKTDDYQRWHLIVTGPRAGEVWLESEFGVVRYPNCTFTEWLLRHLDGSWEAYAADCAQRDEEIREKRKKEAGPRAQCLKYLKQSCNRMNPPASIEEVRLFEEKHNIRLPEDYVKFVTEIGNGGKDYRLKYPKIYSLSDCDAMESLDKPFFFQTQEQLERVTDQLGISKEFPYIPWEELVPLCDLNCYTEDEKVDPWFYPIQKNLKGCLPIFAPEITQNPMQLFMILNGEFRGEIWVANRYKLIVKSNFRFMNGDKVNLFNLWEAYLYYQYDC